ncbi:MULTISPECIES: DUF6171 family protein [Bacillaceae]|uniref:Small CPxCG-related zinc finger protein n=1 Tax=Evansella alkalicola TaxID=745819 RepID=A0ABS6JSP7_9BACI|nr:MULTISPECIES: DUF6171 family protein [Bacillaceae]MBU9721579.1 hypothetical protein [Bacillus alkalicola]
MSKAAKTQVRECKSCGINVAVDLDELVDDSAKSVSDELYEERLDLCMDCPSLMYGTTCQHSGELVSYRALYKEKACPFPGEPRWLQQS